MTLILPALLALLLACVLIALGLRGRVARRGRFCRKCRFDLAGIEPAMPEPVCPECGRDLSAGDATRPTLRRKRWLPLVSGLLLLTVSVSLIGVSMSNSMPRVLAVLPDRAVLVLHDLGMDAAYTEIATHRLAPSSTLPGRAWAGLVQDALDHQENTSIVWDPRDGEVLLRAFSTSRLTPEQIERYFDNGLEVYALFPDEIRRGAKEIGVTLFVQSSGRISSLSGSNGPLNDGDDTVWNHLAITAGGLADPAYETPMSAAGYTPVRIPTGTGGGHGSISAAIPLTDLDWDGIKGDETHSFFIRYTLRVERMSDHHLHDQIEGTLNQPVRILTSDARIVSLDTDPGLIARFQDPTVLRLSPLRVMSASEHNPLDGATRSVRLGVIAVNLPVAVVGQAVVIHDGQEIVIGGVSLTTLGSSLISGIDRAGTPGVDDRTLGRWLESGRVTIEIRPDPRLAERSPGIDRILGVPIRFERVPVTEEDISDTSSSIPNPRHTPGRPVAGPTSDAPPGANDPKGNEP